MIIKEVSLKRATFLVFISKYATVIVNLLLNFILARLITPEEFGICAIIFVFTTFFQIISDIGIGTAVIQNKELSQEDNNQIYSFTIYLGVILLVLFSLFSFPISVFYNSRVLFPLGCLLAVSLLFNTCNNVPNALMYKDKMFSKIAFRSFIVNVTGGILAVILALKGFKYYTLVLQSICTSVIIFLWNRSSVKLKFRSKICSSSIRKISDFSKYLFAFNILNYFARNLDNLLIGKFIGNVGLGYYDKSYKLMFYPIQNLVSIITPILHPVLSEHQNNKKYIYDQYNKILKIFSLFGIYISLLGFFSASEIILIVFGPKWEYSITSFAVLSISIWFQMTATSCGAIYASINRTKLSFKSAVLFVPIQIVFIGTGILFKDINIVALGACIGLVLKFFVEYYFLIKKGFGYSLIKFYKQFGPDLAIYIFCFLILSVSNFVNLQNIFLSFLYKTAVLTVAFSAAVVMTKQYKFFLVILPDKWRKK